MKLGAVLILSAGLLSAAAESERRLRLDLAHVNGRAAALLSTVRLLEDSLRPQGLSLHPDIVRERLLLESELDEAAEALRDRDLPELADRIARARGRLDVLRRKL
jgi:hypothetical protein